MGLFGAGDPPCPAGSICSGQAATPVGSAKTKIYHASTTTLRTDGPPVTDVYIIKDGSWQKAASTTDGGKTYTFDDDVAGAALKQDLSSPQAAIHKNVDANINKAADKAGVPKETKDTLLDSNTNKAGDNEGKTGDSQPAPQPLLDSTSVADKSDTRKQFPDCVYPLDLGKTKQDVIKFTMLEYVPKDFSRQNFGFSDRAQDRNGIGTVILPIPGGIQDTNSVQWAGQNMNALEAGLADLALSGITGGADKFFGNLQQQADRIRGGNSEVSTAVAAAFAGAASGTGGQLLTRTTGAVINPNLELLFSGPALRTFSFQFKLNAREAAESKEIVKILRFFKQGSAAQKSNSHLFLKSPHTFQIQYLHRGPSGEDNPFMNKIKECALQSVAVNYTPEGNYATFPDGEMTSYELTLQFSELEPVFNNDYENDNDTTIGF
jgi:hypothetical protein